MNSFPNFIFSIASNLFELVTVLGAFLIAVGLFLRYDWFVSVNSMGAKKERVKLTCLPFILLSLPFTLNEL